MAKAPEHILTSDELDDIEDLLNSNKTVNPETVRKMLVTIDYWESQFDDQLRRKRKAHEVSKSFSKKLKGLTETLS